jgi:repressor LexA
MGGCGGMKALTERQAALLAFIEKRIAEQGYAPSFREIGVEFGIRSTNGVNDHLRALQRKGYLRRGEQKSRAFAPTRPGAMAMSIRLLGLCREFGWDGSGDAVEFLRALLARAEVKSCA